MSLYEDLAKNRAVFERLTRTRRPEQNNSFNKTGFKYTEEDGALKAGFSVKDEPVAVKSYSLSLGEARIGISLSQPDEIAAPPLSGQAPKASADPLEPLYYRLEVEARRSSQLNGEEDFFE